MTDRATQRRVEDSSERRLAALRALPLLILALGLGSLRAEAVIVGPGSGTQNTTAPADDPGWANVGSKRSLGVVYIGNRWVVTAAHVGIGTVTFGGVAYDAIPGHVGFRSDRARADRRPDRLQAPRRPGRARARDRERDSSRRYVDRDDRIRARSRCGDSVERHRRLVLGTSAAKRWGTNLVGSAPAPVTIGANVTNAFWTDFTKSPPRRSRASERRRRSATRAARLFVKNGGIWQLAGVLFAIGSYQGQPATPPSTATRPT